MSRVLIITADAISSAMAGPGIRALNLGLSLAGNHEVRVVTIGEYSPILVDIFVSQAKSKDLRAHVAWAETVIGQGFIFAIFPWIKKSKAKIVVDLYDPLHLEQLEDTSTDNVNSRTKAIDFTIAAITEQLRYADFVICASEKQRDFWLGYLSALGRLNPRNYEKDPSLRELIDVVPFGISKSEPQLKTHGLRGKVPGISKDDFVLIWGGGIYNWFDPLTLIRAVERVAVTQPTIRLFFMGLKHPNPAFAGYAMSSQAVNLAEELGILDRNVFFNESWVPFDDRANFLLDANVGVSTHFIHLETAYSFRTRILDYLWTGLPILSTDGDTFASIIIENQLGLVVPPNSVEDCAAAIISLMTDSDSMNRYRENVLKYREHLRWDKVVGPLDGFISRAEYAPDRQRPLAPIPLKVQKVSWLEAKWLAAIRAYEANGIKGVWDKSLHKLKNAIGK